MIKVLQINQTNGGGIFKAKTTRRGRKSRSLDKELSALRSLIPGSGQESDLALVYHAIAYIKSLEHKLAVAPMPRKSCSES